MSDDETPLDRLFADEDEHPDRVDVGEITAMNADEFVARLEVVAEASEKVADLANDLERLRKTGLREEDAKDLLYGRNAGMAKRDIEAVFTAVDDVRRGNGDLLVRLLSDVSGLNLSDTREVLDELERLRNYYADETEGPA